MTLKINIIVQQPIHITIEFKYTKPPEEVECSKGDV